VPIGLLERNIFHHILPVCGVRGGGDEFEVFDELADGAAELVAEDQSTEGLAFPLPIFS
jgi:hypothetical protein